MIVVALLVAGVAARLALPSFLRWYVNRTISQNPQYKGRIGDIDVHLWRGAYTIHDVRLNKVTGNVPVPFYSARRLDLAMQWDALVHGKAVGQVIMDRPELNFVDAPTASESQTGGGGPWLDVLEQLFPFRLNRAVIRDGAIHFRAYATQPPVDVYLSRVDATVENLTNIRDEVRPLAATVRGTALAMDQARLELEMKLNPFSYHPSFDLALRLLGLDVTKINSLSLAYGQFDFKRGFFDLVIDLRARSGQVDGYVKPLFRDLQVFSLAQDIRTDNPIQFFWEALLGLTTGILRNPPRDQFGTLIPLHGSFDNPRAGILTAVGNVLRNAFVRAYLPRLEGNRGGESVQFGPASFEEELATGNKP